MQAFISRKIFYPLWDLYDRSVKLKEWRRLESAQRETAEARDERRLTALQRLTAHARRTAPFYGKGDFPEIRTLTDLKKWPLVEKADIRNKQNEFLSDRFSKDDLIQSKTGGSTGFSLQLFFDKQCEEKRNAAALMSNRWAGWELGEEVGALWGNPPSVSSFKEKIRNRLLDRVFFLDTMTMDAHSMDNFLKEIQARSAQYLFGHAHSLFIFARYLENKKIMAPKMAGIVSTSMMLLPPERTVIENVFKCSVTDRYGCEEAGLIASQCERHGGFHLNTEHLIVEFLDDQGQDVPPGHPGNIVITDLNNFGMPLIRYKVGDIGVPSREACPCGRTLPLMDKVVGRTADFLVNENGSLTAGVSLVERTLTAIDGLEQLQLIQNSRSEVAANVVPDKNFTQKTKDLLIAELKGSLGRSIEVTINMKEKLDQDQNGKYRFAICKIDAPLQEASQ